MPNHLHPNHFPAEDPDAPASDEERALASQLRDALLDPQCEHQDADFARKIREKHASCEPREIDPKENEALISRALAKPARLVDRGSLQRIRPALFVVAPMAAAASVLFFLRMTPEQRPASHEQAVPRSTQELFGKPWGRGDAKSAQIDRIVSMRGRDLRQNRFTRWGVR